MRGNLLWGCGGLVGQVRLAINSFFGSKILLIGVSGKGHTGGLGIFPRAKKIRLPVFLIFTLRVKKISSGLVKASLTPYFLWVIVMLG